MKTDFAGFPAELGIFFRGLEKHNNREWFQRRKAIYEEKVKAPMYTLIEAINRRMMRFAPDYVTDPGKAVYRIYRDTRFSANKAPYKTHQAALFYPRNLEKNSCAGLFFAVSHKGVEIAGGLYMPSAGQLRAVRAHIAANHEKFRRIVTGRRLGSLLGELQGERLTRAPKGFAPGHPALDLLRYKQWLIYRTFEPELAASPEILDALLIRFRALTPMVEFLNEPLAALKRSNEILL